MNIKELEEDNVLDEISEYMFGIDSILERMILRYIFKSKNYTASHGDIKYHFVGELHTCSERRLTSRLNSLLKFRFINRTEINNHTFYTINDEWLKELRNKNIKSY